MLNLHHFSHHHFSHMELLDQFAQPTRLACFSEMTSMSQLPQPSNPTNIYNMPSVSSTPEDKHTYPRQDLESTQHIKPSKAMQNHSTKEAEEETVDEMVQILVECLDQVNIKNYEFLLRKFFSELEKETSLEKFIVERLKHSKVKAISVLIENHPECLQQGQVRSEENSMQRDLDFDLMERHNFRELVEALSPKLERFKVRTVYPGGVVTMEKK